MLETLLDPSFGQHLRLQGGHDAQEEMAAPSKAWTLLRREANPSLKMAEWSLNGGTVAAAFGFLSLLFTWLGLRHGQKCLWASGRRQTGTGTFLEDMTLGDSSTWEEVRGFLYCKQWHWVLQTQQAREAVLCTASGGVE